VIAGAPRLVESVTQSHTSDAAGNGGFEGTIDGSNRVTNRDGSFSIQISKITNDVNNGGRLVASHGQSASLSNDGIGNWTGSGKII